MYWPYSVCSSREALLGRVVDALGNPIDGKGAINTTENSQLKKWLLVL